MNQSPNAGKDQSVPNIAEQDIDLVQKYFKGGDDALLKSIRALFYGFDITKGEKEAIKDAFKDPELLAFFKKRLLPDLDRNSPIGIVQDQWLGMEQMVNGQHRDVIEQAICYKQGVIELTARAMALLENPNSKDKIDLSYTPDIKKDPLAVKLMIRNQFIRHIDGQFSMILIIGAAKKSQVMDALEKIRKQKDSNK